jgi:hypothetical protein
MPSSSIGKHLTAVVAVALLAWGVLPRHAGAARAEDPPLRILQVRLDPPTLHTLIAGDTNRNAEVSVRYRPLGSAVWRQGPPLFRVFPETVTMPVPEQFAGSVFDLVSGTRYQIELRASDPDRPADEIRSLVGRTRPVPREDPLLPREIVVTSAPALQSALAGAMPGDVIVLANGVYPGSFTLRASGTARNPIVIRGESTSGAVLDGQNCGACNVLEITGSFVHVERLTMRNAVRALRFVGEGTRNNVARRLHIQDVVHGIAQGRDQRDFYICDNIIEGRLAWLILHERDEGRDD